MYSDTDTLSKKPSVGSGHDLIPTPLRRERRREQDTLKCSVLVFCREIDFSADGAGTLMVGSQAQQAALRRMDYPFDFGPIVTIVTHQKAARYRRGRVGAAFELAQVPRAVCQSSAPRLPAARSRTPHRA